MIALSISDEVEMPVKILPFVILALALAFLPQYLEKSDLLSVQPGDVSNHTDDRNSQSVVAPVSKQSHYTSGKREVRIKADRSGHYISSFKANGRTVVGLIDTGATYVAINESTARSFGLHLSSADFRHKANTANGVTPAAFARLDAMEIGPIRVRNVDVFILKDHSLSDTLIGMSFISKLSSFRVENSQLILTQ
ncbi:retropepsin-like aspartic protease family protein [Lentilitoribacter sp. EG35]|uniref:retropepsin-like aspartic protease family protein n=1 Tax=Lentilitoribacter sp. EG35 TaxID=3234192 RepID=UPI003460BEBE